MAEALGDSYTLFAQLNEHIDTTYVKTNREWKFYGKNYGWQLKTLLKKRNLFFILPHNGSFSLVFIFGDKAVENIEKSDVPEEVKKTIREAKKYLEGRGFSLKIATSADLEIAKKLTAIKVQN